MNEKIEALVDACWVPDTYAVIGRVGMQLSQTNVRAAIIAAHCIGQERMRERCAKEANLYGGLRAFDAIRALPVEE